MKVICSYCRSKLEDKPPLDNTGTTHSICPACEAHFMPQWNGQTLDEYLDAFTQPVLVVNDQNEVTAVNQAMVDMAGKSRDELVTLRGGDVMECQYARLPGGCGKTEHCELCTIRNTVLAALASGDPQIRARVQLQRTELHDLVISAFPYGNVVRVVIEPA